MLYQIERELSKTINLTGVDFKVCIVVEGREHVIHESSMFKAVKEAKRVIEEAREQVVLS
ncbi:MAG: hypothetical protein JKY55_03920 [Aliivibrio sp.]|uniref:hypothetical protein n=1 Tax=Aliivibrio sp. TaxID=1872443 RepID=UPI001A467C24|nr:hypothetical protein [Aliivibrio sp.]